MSVAKNYLKTILLEFDINDMSKVIEYMFTLSFISFYKWQ